MLSTRVPSLVFAVTLVAGPALAQDPVISRVSIWQPKPGMEAKLEAGIKAHNEFHRKQNDASIFETYVITSGPHSGNYARLSPGRNWKDFDAEAALEKADQADAAINTDPYIASSITEYWRVRPELSHMAPENTPPAAMYSLNFYRVNFAKVDDIVLALKKSKEAAAKAKWPRHFVVFSLVSGGDGPTFLIAQAREKFADFNPPAGKTFADMLDEQLGKDESAARQQQFNGAVQGLFTQIINYRADLSYTPARK